MDNYPEPAYFLPVDWRKTTGAMDYFPSQAPRCHNTPRSQLL